MSAIRCSTLAFEESDGKPHCHSANRLRLPSELSFGSPMNYVHGTLAVNGSLNIFLLSLDECDEGSGRFEQIFNHFSNPHSNVAEAFLHHRNANPPARPPLCETSPSGQDWIFINPYPFCHRNGS